MRRWPFLDHPLPIPFAHRGGAGDWPENTLRAFAGAVALGYRYVETDVHATADGALVAFHDDVLDRVTDGRGAIAALPWSTVRQARVGGEPIPLLEEILGTWPELRVNIDAKQDGSVRPLLETLRRTNAWERVCIGAFSDARLAAVRRLSGDRVCTTLGPWAIRRLWFAGYGVPVGPLAGACVQVPVRRGRVTVITPRFLRAAHRRGLQVHVWTVDERAEMERLLDLGVDGIMTDRPAVLKEVLVRRGRWTA